ncbi:hypothetical protein A3197_11090 [Candidatus Thiodiazotropha endoloripes]|nr:hypothetical protein A3197_11090 [Candidatus Thiodiazotropha endoloripes]
MTMTGKTANRTAPITQGLSGFSVREMATQAVGNCLPIEQGKLPQHTWTKGFCMQGMTPLINDLFMAIHALTVSRVRVIRTI